MNHETDLTYLSAADAAARIRSGQLTSHALVGAYLSRIAERDPVVRAWAWIDPNAALEAARQADAQSPRGPLHGVPVGLKDVIDTADMPTAHGSDAFAGHIAPQDAAAVALLREAGAIILGKLVTAEFATYSPGPTTNPVNRVHTPGGSSSGSAAAVADRQVPLSLGTQTAGSVIRPASFCGTFGFKPGFGRYPGAGVLATSHRLDTVGIFARTVDDLLLLDTLLTSAPPRPPHDMQSMPIIGVYRGQAWEQASPAMRETLKRTAHRFAILGHQIVEVPVQPPFDKIDEAQKIIHKHEAWQCLGTIRHDHANAVSPAFRTFIDEGAAISSDEYLAACATQDEAIAREPDLFSGADILLSPGAPGAAPAGLAATGNPAFNRMTTAMGLPCLGFPAGLDGELPLGLQLIGRSGTDRALLQHAAGIVAALALTP